MKKSGTLGWVIVLAALGGLGYYGWQKYYGPEALAKADNAKKAASRGPAAIPVTIAAVAKDDFPVYLTGLGIVQGYLLVQIDPRPYQAALDQAVAKKAQDEANLANANLDLDRYTKLGEFATRQQLDTQRSTVTQLTAQISADEAAIFSAKTQLDYTAVKSPIPGVAGLREVDIGNIVNAATQTGIVSIAQVEPIAVIFTAPEDQLPSIKEALAQHPLKVIALTTDGKKSLSEGTLAVINNQVDTSSGTIRLKAVFENKDHALWPGQSVSTRLLIQTLKNAIVVPDEAVQHGVSGLYAYAVNAANKAELRKVTVGYSIDGRSVIDAGLSPGEQVITAGGFRVQPGTLVSSHVASSTPSTAPSKVSQE
jgi:multidrug efflux system membrane fusion protein